MPPTLGPGTRVHLVGVGGSGMSAIAELLVQLGCVVSGSDLRRTSVTERLSGLGVHVVEHHAASHVEGADVVVFSSAVPADNAERQAAARGSAALMPRGEMLAQLAGAKRGVAVAGSHGKTTTAAMAAAVLLAGGLDPTVVIGGTSRAFEGGARLGRGELIVVEADESDRSFLRLSPEVAVLTNLDEEHLDAYAGMADLEGAFLRFAEQVPARGCIVAGGGDPGLRRLLPRLLDGAARRGVNVMTCGTGDAGARLHAHDIRLHASGSACRVGVAGAAAAEFELRLAVPGRHNLENALAAVAVGMHFDVPPGVAAAALARYQGAARRLQRHGSVAGVTVIDDYGHHPTEIEAVLQTVRLAAPARVRVVFQPHRYSRTARLLERFGAAFAAADDVLVAAVYGAGEAPIPGATAEAVAAAVRRVSGTPVRVVESLDAIPELVAAEARAGDVVVTLGAGSIADMPGRIVTALRRKAGGGP